MPEEGGRQCSSQESPEGCPQAGAGQGQRAQALQV